MAIIREVTFGDGSVVRITDWGDYPIFSRLIVNAAQATAGLTETYIFQYQKGGQIPITNTRASAADTNMPGPGQLPLGHQMLVYSLQVIPDEFADGDYPKKLTCEQSTGIAYVKFRKLFHQTTLKLVVEQTKSFVEGRLDYFPAGGAFHIDSRAFVDDVKTSYAAGYQITNGVKSWAATRRLAIPVHLGALETFYVAIDWPRGGLGLGDEGDPFPKPLTGFGLTVRMTGPRQRPTA